MTPRAYLLCGTPRSGSTMLCNLLARTGIAGQPDSYFRPESLPDFAAEWGVALPDRGFGQAYLDQMMAAARGRTPILGLRIMWENLAFLCAGLRALGYHGAKDGTTLRAAFGPVLFVHLGREDKAAQAVSLVRAMQSGLWHRHADGRVMEQTGPAAEPVFDAGQIRAAIAQLDAADKAWTAWFAGQAITPLRMTYEALAQDPQGHLRAILRRLGADPRAADIPVGTARLADAASRQWLDNLRQADDNPVP